MPKLTEICEKLLKLQLRNKWLTFWDHSVHYLLLIVVGFDRVFPMEKLFLFSPTELQMILCGDQSPQWTRDDIVNYTEPKLGYTRERSVCLVDLNNCLLLLWETHKLLQYLELSCSRLLCTESHEATELDLYIFTDDMHVLLVAIFCGG